MTKAITRVLPVLVALAVTSAAVAWWLGRAAAPAAAARPATVQSVSAVSADELGDEPAAARRTEAYGTYRLPHVRLGADLDGLQAALGAAGEAPGLAPPPGAARTASGYATDEVRGLALHAIARVSAAGAGQLDLIEVESATKNLVSGSALIEYTLVFVVYVTDRSQAVKLVADMAFDAAPRLLRARLYSAPAADPADPDGLSAQAGGRPPPAGDATPWKPALAFDPQRDRIIAPPPKK